MKHHDRRRPRLALVLGSVWLATARSWAGCELKQIEMPVRIVDQRPIATLTLNGVEAKMLLDSGAFYSFLSPSTAARLNLPLRGLPYGFQIEGYTGSVEAQRTRVDKVGLLGADIPNVEFLVGGNELGAGIMGILGRNFLSWADTEYDLAHGVVRMNFPKGDCDDTVFAYWAGQAPVIVAPLERKGSGDSTLRVAVAINGKRTLAILDTGAPTTALSLRAARRAGIEERDLTPHGRAGGAGEGRVRSWTAPVAMFELAGEKISNNRLEINDTDSLGEGLLLGLDYFLSHRLYVSREQRKIYITWNGGSVFAPLQANSGTFDSQYAALPQEVDRNDADALARRGAAAVAAGNFPRALEDLNRACELAPGVADYFFARARLHLAMRQSRLALADLDEALRLEPALAEARLRRAWVRTALSDRPGALDELARLDSELPPSSHLREEMGKLYALFDQAADALRQFNLWTGSHPKDARLPQVLNDRCWLRARLNIELSLALQDCREAVDKDDGEAWYLDSLGWTYLRMGDAARAQKAFDSAIKLKALPFSLYGRALALRKLDDAAGSERDLAAARKLQPKIDDEVRKQGFEFADGLAQAAAPGH